MEKRILVAVPVTATDWDPVMRAVCTAVAGPNTKITVDHLEHGVEEIETDLDEARTVGPLLDMLWRRRDDFDGFITDCYCDPGLASARELLQKPVVGIAEAAEHLAGVIGHRIGIVSSSGRSHRGIEEKARARGTAEKIVAVQSWHASPLALVRKPEDALAALKRCVDEMRSNYSVDTIIIACGSNLAIDRDLSREVGLPVIVPEQAAVKILEAILDCRLPMSPAWPAPRAAEILDPAPAAE